MNNSEVIVVGAGIAGLTAAYDLKEAGFNPIVIEKSERVGGRMWTEKIDGFTMDAGAQFFQESYPILNSLIDRNGLRDKYVHTTPYLGVVKGGKIRKTHRFRPLSLITTGALSIPSWIRFMAGSAYLMKKTNHLDLNNILDWNHLDDLDGDRWSKKFFGKEVTDKIVEPLIESLFYQTLQENSKGFTISMVASMLLRFTKTTTDLVDGMAVLPLRMGSQLDVRYNTTVKSINAQSEKVVVETDKGTFTADRLVLAAPAPEARLIYQPKNSIEKELLSTPYSSTLVVYLAMDESFQIDPKIRECYGITIPPKERENIVAITIEESKEKTRRGTGHLFGIFLYSEAGKRMLDWDDARVTQAVLAEVEKYFPGVSRHLRFSKIYRWKNALTKTPVGRGETVARYRQSVGPETRIFLAGDYTGMSSTEGAAATGRWAANRIMKYM